MPKDLTIAGELHVCFIDSIKINRFDLIVASTTK